MRMFDLSALTSMNTVKLDLFTAGVFQLVYGNPLVTSDRSLPVRADNIVHAVTIVLGGCDKVTGNAYQVGRLFGTVEKIK